MSEVLHDEYGRIEDPKIAEEMAYKEKPLEDALINRKEAEKEAREAGNEALSLGENPKSAIATYLKVLDSKGQLKNIDTVLALIVLDGQTTKEQAEEFINGAGPYGSGPAGIGEL